MAQRGQNLPKQIENNPLATQIGSYGLCWCGKKAQNGLPGCPLLCSNLVSYLPTQNRPSKPKCVAKRQFQPIWATFWPPWGHNWDILGLANGPNWSAWFQHRTIKWVVTFDLNFENDSFGPFGALILNAFKSHCIMSELTTGFDTQTI